MASVTFSTKRDRPGTSSGERWEDSNKKTKTTGNITDVQSGAEIISLTDINLLDDGLRNYVNDPKYKIGVEQRKFIIDVV